MAEKTPKLSDAVEFKSGPAMGRIGDLARDAAIPSLMLHGRLEFNVQIPVADGSDSRWINHTKDKIRRQIVEMIQPRDDFEAAFQELRSKIQGLESPDMADTMKILGAVAALKDKLLLK